MRRPSAALLVAIVALVVAMTGTTYAALELGKNSVGTKQLKANAITGVKVKDHSLTGQDINLTQLGTVPSASTAGTATHAVSAESAAHAVSADSAAHAGSADSAAHAGSADSASAIAPPEPIHIVGAPGEPQFMSGSTNHAAPLGASYPFVGFYKDREGIVHLEGVVDAGKEGSTPGLIFVLPVGFRPAIGVLLPFEPAEKRGLLIGGPAVTLGATDLSGAVYAPETEAGAIPLDGITFRAYG
jgi:hypothetical protein